MSLGLGELAEGEIEGVKIADCSLSAVRDRGERVRVERNERVPALPKELGEPPLALKVLDSRSI